MPDIRITDTLDKPVESVKVDLAHPSSLVSYLKTQALHLAVVPDLLARKDLPLTQAATKPIEFQAHAGNKFQLGAARPEIDITPTAQAAIRVNASPGTNLFEDDPFPVKAAVPDRTGYVSVAFQGSLDINVSAPSGDLTFGFEAATSIALEYWKAFPLGAGEPILGDALGRTLSSFVIPAGLDDLDARQFAINDIATASGAGTLTVSGAVKVSVAPNPLASVALPLGVGDIAVQAGATLGLSASLTINGAYQVRARRLDAETIELSFLQQDGETLIAAVSPSGGVTAKFGDTDLIAALLGAVSTDPSGDTKLLADLQPAEAKAIAAAIKSSIDHNLQASLTAALARVTEGEAVFQYEIRPALLDAGSRNAVNAALRGDLSGLTALEEKAKPGGVLAPGLRVRSTVFSNAVTAETSLKLNLLGIFNHITVSDLIRAGEVLADPITGDLTIKDKTTGTVISAITEPVNRAEPLRKVLFDSVVLTTTYVAGKAVRMPGFACTHAHFALHAKTGRQQMNEYLNWFAALNLLQPAARPGILAAFVPGSPSTCVLRTAFDDAACHSLFFDANGQRWAESHYLDYARRAMRALLQPDDNPYDRYRYQLLDDATWPQALEIGAAQDLATLVGVSATHPAVGYLIGDVYAITEWAGGMVDAGKKVQEMREFLKTADPATLDANPGFHSRRNALQKKIAAMLGDSKMRFDEPWGMVCLFWSAGSPQPAYGKIALAGKVALELGRPLAAAVDAG